MPTIDERIVEMQFSNKQFEQGVAESIRSLEKLKQALDLDSTIDSLKEFQNVSDSIDTSNIERAAEHIASLSTVMGKVLDNIKGNIAQQITNFATGAVGKLKDMAMAATGIKDMGEGFDKYAKKTKAVQTIMNATGKTIEDVEKVLAKLMEYTDETSYDFTQMVTTIGKFTSAGVDLEVAERAMEGLANEAALSGAGIEQANHAMYNLAQALSAGHVKVQDWASIENMNMATKEFKEELIKTAVELGILKGSTNGVGTIVTTNAKKLASAEKALAKAQSLTGKAAKNRAEKIAAAEERIRDATKTTTVDYLTFRETLSEGWLTSDVLIKTLERYTKGASELGDRAYAAAQKALTYGDAIQAIKDAITSGWSRTFELLFGNLEEAQVLWTDFCNSIIEFVDLFIDARNSILENWHALGGYNDMIEAATNLWEIFMDIVYAAKDAINAVFPGLSEGGNILAGISEHIKNVTAYWKEIIDYGSDTEPMTELLGSIQDIITGVLSVFKFVLRAGETGYRIINSITRAMSPIGDALVTIAAFIANIITSIDNFIEESRFVDYLTNALDHALIPFTEVLQQIADVINTIFGKGYYFRSFSEFWENLYAQFSENEGIITFLNILETIGTVVKKAVTFVSAFGTVFAVALGKYSFDGFKWLWEMLPTALGLIGNLLGDLINKISKSTILRDVMSIALQGIVKLAGWVKTLSNGVKTFLTKAKGVKTFGEAFTVLRKEFSKNKLLTSFVNLISKIGKGFGKILPSIEKLYFVIKGLAGKGISKFFDWFQNGLPVAIDAISNFISKSYEAINKSEALKNIWKGLSSTIMFVAAAITVGGTAIYNAIKSFFVRDDGSFITPFERAGEIISNVQETFSKFADTVKSKLKEVYDSSEFIRNLYDNYLHPFWTKFTEIAKLLKDGIVGFVTTDTSDVSGLIPKLRKRLEAFNHLVEWFNNLTGNLISSVKDFVNNFSFENIFTTFVDELKKIPSLWSAKAEGYDYLKGEVTEMEEDTSSGGLFDRLFNNIKNFGIRIDDIKKSLLEKLDSSGFDMEKVTSILLDALKALAFLRIGAGISKFGKGIKNIGKGFAILGQGTSKTLETLGSSVGSSLKDFTSTISGAFKTFLTGKDGVQSLGDIIIDFTGKMTEATNKRPKDSIGTTFLKLAGSIVMIAGAIALMASIKDPAKLQTGVETLVGVVVVLSAVAGALSTQGTGIEKLGKGLLMIVGSIGVLALSLFAMNAVISGSNAEILNRSLKIIGELIATLGVFELLISVVSGLGSKSSTIEVKLPSILSMCVGVLTLVKAIGNIVKLTRTYGENDVFSAMNTVESFIIKIGILDLAITLVSRIGKNNRGIVDIKMSGILSMCSGIFILVQAISQIAKGKTNNSNFDSAINTIQSFVTRISILEAILAYLSRRGRWENRGQIKVEFSGLLSMCAGIYLLTFAIDRVAKGLSNSKKYETAIYVIEGILTKLGKLEIGLSIANKGAGGFKIGGVLGMCAGIWILVDAIAKLAEYYDYYKAATNNGEKINSFEVALTMMEGLLFTLGITASLMSKTAALLSVIPFSGIAVAVLKFAAFITGVVAVITGLAALYKLLNDWTGGYIADALVEFGWILGRVMGAIVKGFTAPFSEVKDTSAGKTIPEMIEGLIDGFDKVIDKLVPFLEKTKKITMEHVTGIKNLTSCLLAMTKTEVLDSIGAFIGRIGGGESSGSAFIDFANNLVALVNPLQILGESTGSINIDGLNAYIPALQAVKSLAMEATAIGWESMWQNVASLFPGENSIISFIDNLIAMAPKLIAVGFLAKAINVDGMKAYVPVFQSLNSISAEVTAIKWEQRWQSIASAFMKGEGIVDFVGHLCIVAPKIVGLSNLSKNIDTTGIYNIAYAIQALGIAAKAVPEAGGWIQKIVGEHDLEKFGSQLGALASGLYNFYWKTKPIPNDFDPTGAITALTAIGSAAEAVPKVNGVFQKIFGEHDLGDKFGAQLKVLGQGLKDFYDATNGDQIPKDFTVDGVVVAMEKLGEFEKTLEEHGGVSQWISGEKDIGKFGEGIGSLGANIKKFYEDTSSVDADRISMLGGTLAALSQALTYTPPIDVINQNEKNLQDLINSLATLDFSQFESAAKKVLEHIAKGINNPENTADKDPVNALKKLIGEMYIAADEFYDDFVNLGARIAQAISVGVARDGYKVTEEIGKVVGNGKSVKTPSSGASVGKKHTNEENTNYRSVSFAKSQSKIADSTKVITKGIVKTNKGINDIQKKVVSASKSDDEGLFSGVIDTIGGALEDVKGIGKDIYSEFTEEAKNIISDTGSAVNGLIDEGTKFVDDIKDKFTTNPLSVFDDILNGSTDGEMGLFEKYTRNLADLANVDVDWLFGKPGELFKWGVDSEEKKEYKGTRNKEMEKRIAELIKQGYSSENALKRYAKEQRLKSKKEDLRKYDSIRNDDVRRNYTKEEYAEASKELADDLSVLGMTLDEYLTRTENKLRSDFLKNYGVKGKNYKFTSKLVDGELIFDVSEIKRKGKRVTEELVQTISSNAKALEKYYGNDKDSIIAKKKSRAEDYVELFNRDISKGKVLNWDTTLTEKWAAGDLIRLFKKNLDIDMTDEITELVNIGISWKDAALTIAQKAIDSIGTDNKIESKEGSYEKLKKQIDNDYEKMRESEVIPTYNVVDLYKKINEEMPEVVDELIKVKSETDKSIESIQKMNEEMPAVSDELIGISDSSNTATSAIQKMNEEMPAVSDELISVSDSSTGATTALQKMNEEMPEVVDELQELEKFDILSLFNPDQLSTLASELGISVDQLKSTISGAVSDGFDENTFSSIDSALYNKFGIHLPESMKEYAGYMAQGLGLGFTESQKVVTDAEKQVSSAMQSAMMEDNGIASPSTVYHWFGEMMIEGLANGLSDGSWKVTEMAKKVASDALMAAKKELGIASPSDEFIWIGRMICDGFSLGLDNYSAIVGQSASELASNAIDVARMGIQGLSDTIKTDPDIIPTIRPVLDLNDLKASTIGVNSFYKDQAMAMKSLTMARGIAAKEQMRNIAEPVQANDSGKLMETINKLGERIDKLGEDFANTQIYLDGNTMVGYMTPRIDKSLGARAILARRMN